MPEVLKNPTAHRRKVLMVTMGMDIGGAETHILELSGALQKLGYEILIATSGGVYESELQKMGIRCVHVSTSTRELASMYSARRSLRRLIREEKPDVVHAHARIPAFLCGSICRQLGIPFVTTAHWTFEVTPLLRRITDWGSQTIAVSEDIRTYLIENYGVSPAQIRVTVNGIDTDKFSPDNPGKPAREEFDIPEDAPVIACVTRLHESRARSAILLAEAAEELARKLPGLRVMIVGDGECLEKLRTMAEKTNRSLGYPCLILTGGRTDVARLVAACDLFVGVSRAALEAMSAAKPTILCGNEGYGGPAGLERAAHNSRTNYCCREDPASDVSGLKRDILELMGPEAEAKRLQLGEEGRRIVLEQYSLRRMAEDAVAVYDRAIHPLPVVTVSGYYGYHNRGDDTILGTLCGKYREQSELCVLSYRPEETAKEYGVTAVPRFSPHQLHRVLRRSTLLISGGGSLLQDRTSNRSLWYYLYVISAAKKRHCRVIVYANGVGPISRPLNRRMTAKVLTGVQTITVRDAESAKELSDMGVTSEVIVTADPVFAAELPDTAEGLRYLQTLGIPQGSRILGISLRELGRTAAAQQTNAAKLAGYIDRVCGQSGCVPVFICMQSGHDNAAAAAVSSRLQTPSWVIPETCSTLQLMAAIHCMEAVVSMRLHTLIFAAAGGTPVLGFNYDPKISALVQLLDMPLLADVPDFDPETGAAQTLELLSHRAAAAEKIRAVAEQQRLLASENDRLLSNLLAPVEQKQLRLLHIIGGGDTGGAKTHVLSLLQGLIRQGHRVQLVCFIDGDFSNEAKALGIPTEVLPRNNVVHSYCWLKNWIAANRPDVVHCHGAKANMFGQLFAKKNTVVTTVHSDPWLDYMGRPAAAAVYGRINRAALRRIPNRICVSDALKDLLISRGFASDSMEVMYNGVDFSTGTPALSRQEFLQKYGIEAQDTVVFGIAARLAPVKDIPTLLKAFAAAVRENPKLRLLIAGDGEDAGMLRSMASELCPAGTVAFTGWLSDTDSFYGAIDVNMLTSVSEGLPYAIPEGGKMGCATIATEVGGVPLIIQHEVTGLLFQPGDTAVLTEYMLRLAAAPELRRKLGKALYERTKRDFSLDATLARQQQIYRRLIRRAGN